MSNMKFSYAEKYEKTCKLNGTRYGCQINIVYGILVLVSLGTLRVLFVLEVKGLDVLLDLSDFMAEMRFEPGIS